MIDAAAITARFAVFSVVMLFAPLGNHVVEAVLLGRFTPLTAIQALLTAALAVVTAGELTSSSRPIVAAFGGIQIVVANRP